MYRRNFIYDGGADEDDDLTRDYFDYGEENFTEDAFCTDAEYLQPKKKCGR